MTKPILVFGYGNPSRGDDAVSPLALDYLSDHLNLSNIELLSDFQLQIEHALDLQDRELVVFVDASVDCPDSFAFTPLTPAQDHSYTSHALSPAALLSVYQAVSKQPIPPCFLLSIQAEAFELGTGLSERCAANLQQACRFLEKLLTQPLSAIVERQSENINR
ncbi:MULTISPECIES: hydrogenase maturation protease [Methylomonas]|uniref:Ni/Fe hydrogenase n=2 Tax=Methylomonas TaxID=416 RepID=A0A140E5B6_9GAMM|nr:MULTISPECIES: hydrogenase maturation protease [Methylomonas]AMK75590.1 Ni/Fe hydrogenase [Methylomonas denitrificans]OAI09205.1 Ni/Fe hydrogenase [Methylomonas methanica]TCV79087.1 hydrogenase maturation protease [Methylomonas methanica]